MAVKRAEAISVTTLSKSIDKAVELAARRQGLKPGSGNLVFPGHILGRVIRDLDDANAAFAFAAEVTKSVNASGANGEPAVFKIGPDILAGYIERLPTPLRF
jgi:hypothetical protein